MAVRGGDPEAPYRYGFVGRHLDAQRTAALVSDRPHGGNVNDVLLAALHLAIAEWNSAHGEPSRQITTMMPLNMRPPEFADDVVALLTGFADVTTGDADHTGRAAAIAAVVAQSAVVKQDRAALMRSLMLAIARWPLAVRRRLPLVLAATGHRLVPTTVLSNMGRPADPPTFEADGSPPSEFRFGPPVQMPLGASLGALTVGDRMHLTLRYSLAQFDRPAGGGVHRPGDRPSGR